MQVNLDKFELYYLLESCFRGSHLRTSTILRFVDEWYPLLTPEQRECYYRWILRDVYDGTFRECSRLCGADAVFMACFNPDNRYRVTADNGSMVDAFLMNGRYYVNSSQYVDKMLWVEKLIGG